MSPLTFTADQASRGQDTFGRNCTACHGEDLRGLDGGPPLVGDNFARWFAGSVGLLFTYMSSAMPADNPGALSTTQYVNLIAFLASANGFAAGEDALPDDTVLLDAMGFTQP